MRPKMMTSGSDFSTGHQQMAPSCALMQTLVPSPRVVSFRIKTSGNLLPHRHSKHKPRSKISMQTKATM